MSPSLRNVTQRRGKGNIIKDLKMPSFGMCRRVGLVSSDVSVDRVTSIFRVEKSASEEERSSWLADRTQFVAV
jgi:hypothetical protein